MNQNPNIFVKYFLNWRLPFLFSFFNSLQNLLQKPSQVSVYVSLISSLWNHLTYSSAPVFSSAWSILWVKILKIRLQVLVVLQEHLTGVLGSSIKRHVVSGRFSWPFCFAVLMLSATAFVLVLVSA